MGKLMISKKIVTLLEIGVRGVHNDLKEGIPAFDRLPAPPFLGFLGDPQLLKLFNLIPDFKKNLTIFSKSDLLQKRFF